MFSDMLTDAQKSAIADVAIASSELEVEVERCIIEVCNLHWPHGAVLLENVRIEAKLTIFYRLLEIEFQSGVPEGFKSAYMNLKDLNAQRNTIIHGQWTLKSLAEYRLDKPPKPGQGAIDIERKNIVAHRRKRGKQPPAIAARQIKKIAELMTLNCQLLHQLFWEHFADRVRGLSGLPQFHEQSAAQLLEVIRKRSQKLQ